MIVQFVTIVCLSAVSQAYYIKSPFASSRVIGGEDAKPGEFPHQVAIDLLVGDPTAYMHSFCSGSVINERWILTAAHCLEEADKPNATVTVTAGKHYMNKTEPTEQKLRIESYFVNKNFTGSMFEKFKYDTALIKLASPLQFNKRVAPINLPKRDSQPAGTVIVSGWGFFIDNPPAFPVRPNILQKAEIGIIDLATCSKSVVDFGAKYNVTISEDVVGETNFCTAPSTSGGAGSCQGDSGGPVMHKHSNGQLELVGIVSWGTGEYCGSPEGVNVYAKVSSFIDWIDNIISKN